jgi:Dolichyl-phosphate-mannose-protein mannosyltransferase
MPRLTPLLVTFASICVLGYGISRSDIASAYSDPVAKIRAQDESLYANSALRMANGGGWSTPTFLGRFILLRPPLLVWLSAISMKLFGTSLAALRAPALLAGVAATTLLFLWALRSRSPAAGWCCVLLLLSNPLWHIFARLCYTDMLFVTSVAAALFTLYLDPILERGRTRFIFAACCAAGILAKSVAGVLPLLIWFLYCALRRDARPPLSRIVQVCGITASLAAPWHLYQIVVHPQWFWADYVRMQLFGFGFQPPAQSSHEAQLWFYLKRVSITDPILVAFAALALPAFWKQLRHRSSTTALLLASWIAVVSIALMAFSYRNLPYALGLVPPLALLGAWYSPGGAWRVAILTAALIGKMLIGNAWGFGLPMLAADPIPSAAPLRAYADRGRPNDLIIVSPDDEFYSATLRIPRVRYAFIDRDGVVVRYAPHFTYLGITVTVDQFLHFDELYAGFLDRLRSWGLNSPEPLATSIVANSPADVARLAEGRPESDFFLPRDLVEALPEDTLTTHEVLPAGNGRLFLLARQSYSAAKVAAKPQQSQSR